MEWFPGEEIRRVFSRYIQWESPTYHVWWRPTWLPDDLTNAKKKKNSYLNVLRFDLNTYIRGLSSVFRNLVTLVLQSTKQSTLSQSLTFLRLYVLRTFWHTTAICVVYSNLKDSFRLKKKMGLNREHFRAIIFYNFLCGLTLQQCIDELNSIFGDEAPS